MLNTTQPEATLQRLNPDSRYQIQVRAFNSVQYSWSYASIEVDTEKDGEWLNEKITFCGLKFRNFQTT